MRLRYDPEADALYITLKGHGVDHTVRIGPDVAIDYGPDGEIHGIEILAAKEHLSFGESPEVMVENLKVANTG
jgi:uncharacterized protein YuzE